MKMPTYLRISAVTTLAVTVWGCGPPEITPVAPPGIDLQRLAVPTEEEAAQAVGEAIGDAAASQVAQAKPSSEPLNIPESPPTAPGETKTKTSGLKYETLKEGNGVGAKVGQTVTVHYTGTLTSGKEFDTSRGKGSGYTLTLGRSGVIPGWHEGLTGMKVGERRKLTIPPELAYGPRGAPPDIPPDATLIFDIEMLKIQ